MTYPRMRLPAAALLATVSAACVPQAPQIGVDASVTPDPLPPPRDPCAQYQLRFPGAGSPDPNGCPTIDCHCGTYTGPLPTLFLGCVQSVDCSAACAGGDWIGCAISRCSSNAQCADLGRKCVVAPGASDGSCEDWS